MPLVMGLRYPLAGLRSLRGSRLDMLDEGVLRMRVRLTDCDVNFHVNNGRFLTLMDLGRIDLVGRSGLLGVFRREGWSAVAAGATIRFRRELRLGARYQLHTRIAGWDADWTFFEQRFERADGTLAARAYAKVAVLDRDRARVAPSRVVSALGVARESPTLPDELLRWQSTDVG